MDLLKSLYGSQDAINCLLQCVEDGEYTIDEVADTIEALEGTIEHNCDDIATIMTAQEGEIEYISKEIKRLSERLYDIKVSNDRLRNGLQSYLKSRGIRKVHTPTHDFTICKNGGKQPIEITADVYDIPKEYCILTPKPDSCVIRKALESGQELEFARFTERGEHLRIK